MHSGASVNAVTKSGTNAFHGDLFEFVRNHRFNATNPFNAIDPATGKRQGDGLSRNQYGGTFGGPMTTDRLFFFGAYQGTRLRETPADCSPSCRQRRCSPVTSRNMPRPACNTAGAVNLRGPFVDNRIDPSLLSPAALKHDRAPADDADPCGRVTTAAAGRRTNRSTSARWTCSSAPNHSMFGRYMLTTSKWTPPFQLQPENTLVSSQGGRDNKAHAITVGDTMVLSNATVNALRVAVNYTDIHRIHEPLGFDAPDSASRPTATSRTTCSSA